MSRYDIEKGKGFIDSLYDSSLIPSLCKFIEIPNLSRDYDPQYATNGLLEHAADHIKQWVEALKIDQLHCEIIKHPGYTPVLYTEIKGQLDTTIMFYGHFDKQPHMDGWHPGKGPITPVIQNGRLYGRGGADDGYSTYSSMLAIKAVQHQGIPLPRIVMLTEGDEESGGEIQYYLKALKEKIGSPTVIFCLDSGSLDYERLWLTNSLRGYISALLKITVISQGTHSGQCSGIVPSCYKIANILLNRLQNPESGKIHKQFQAQIPGDRYEQSYHQANILGNEIFHKFQFVEGVKIMTENPLQAVLNRAWKPQLTVTGITGIPSVATAGNVMHTSLQLRLSLRLPPTLDAHKVAPFLPQLLTKDPPFNAKVQCTLQSIANGFNAPTYELWLKQIIEQMSLSAYGQPYGCTGEGGSIPFMGSLANMWPTAQFIITGVLGPESNAHGPNQFLHIDYTRRITHAMALAVARTAQHYAK